MLSCRKKIEQLSEKIRDNNHSKTVEEQLTKQLQVIKSEAEEREMRLSTDYAAKLTVKCNEVATLTQQISNQLTRMEELKTHWKTSKEQELFAIASRHRQEMEASEMQQQEKVTLHLSTIVSICPNESAKFNIYRLPGKHSECQDQIHRQGLTISKYYTIICNHRYLLVFNTYHFDFHTISLLAVIIKQITLRT